MKISQTIRTQNRFGFYLLMMYLLIEYGRPQALIPALGYLRPGIIIIGLLGIYLIVTGKVRFENAQSKCMLGFLLLSAIHVPIAVNNYWAFQGFRMFMIYLIIFLSITAFINSSESLNRFINFWIWINVLNALVGIKHGGKVSFSGYMGEENDFALVMNMAIPLAYFMFVGSESIKKKIIYLSACGLFIIAEVASLSRGGFVGLVPVIFYCWYKTPKKILATIIIALLIGFLYVTAPSDYWNEIKSIKEENIKEGTGETRWYLWKIAWRIFLDHPIIGVGPGNYPWRSGEYQPEEDLNFRPSIAGKAAHSIYFTLIPEFGLAGILLFSAMLYHSYKNSRAIIKKKNLLSDELKKSRFILLGTIGALLGYLGSGIFLSVFYYAHFWLLLAIASAVKNIFALRDSTRYSIRDII